MDIDVTGTGRGIAAEHLPRLLDQFYRGDAARSRAAGGTGLGLGIAKLLVDAHRDELTIYSTVGVGTPARVRLALRANDAAAHRAVGDGGAITHSSVVALLRH